MLLVDEIVGSFERERSLTAAAMARVGDLRCWEEQFRRSWQRVYAVDAEFTPAVLEKIARRMLRLARFIRVRFWDFAIAERLTAEQDFYTEVAVRLLAHACAERGPVAVLPGAQPGAVSHRRPAARGAVRRDRTGHVDRTAADARLVAGRDGAGFGRDVRHVSRRRPSRPLAARGGGQGSQQTAPPLAARFAGAARRGAQADSPADARAGLGRSALRDARGDDACEATAMTGRMLRLIGRSITLLWRFVPRRRLTESGFDFATIWAIWSRQHREFANLANNSPSSAQPGDGVICSPRSNCRAPAKMGGFCGRQDRPSRSANCLFCAIFRGKFWRTTACGERQRGRRFPQAAFPGRPGADGFGKLRRGRSLGHRGTGPSAGRRRGAMGD